MQRSNRKTKAEQKKNFLWKRYNFNSYVCKALVATSMRQKKIQVYLFRAEVGEEVLYGSQLIPLELALPKKLPRIYTQWDNCRSCDNETTGDIGRYISHLIVEKRKEEKTYKSLSFTQNSGEYERPIKCFLQYFKS